ncbi:porin [Comamonas sp. JNW]|uniref:porin n=3 Tax=unclassified Comamonas TaxID=2638500 RepID=UPI0014037E8D|nr:porin [Comamonas sp. JNW]
MSPLFFPRVALRSAPPRQPSVRRAWARTLSGGAAALAAAAAMPALAQTSLRLYGTVDAAIGWTRVSGAPTQKNLLSGGQSDSLWGLQGREALGSSSYAAFALEGGLDAAHGAPDDPTRPFNYQSWVGVGNASLGELRLGRQYTVGQAFVSAIEVGAWRDFGVGALLRASDNYQVSQQISWRSPQWGGVQLGASYSFDAGDAPAAGTTGSATHKLYSLALRYEDGPWLLAASWEQANAVLLHAGLAGRHPSAAQLGASYNFGVARLAAGWSRQRNGFVGRNGGDGSADLQAAGLKGLGPIEFIDGGRLDALYLGVSIPLNHGELQAQWSQARPNWDWQDSGARAKTSQVMSLGYIHPLSLRTSVYAFVAHGRAYALDAAVDASQTTVSRVAFGLNTRF